MSFSGTTQIPSRTAKVTRAKKAEVLRRKIAILETMNTRLWWKSLLCAFVTVLGFASAFIAAAYFVWGQLSGLTIVISLIASFVTLFAIRNFVLFLWMALVVAVVIVMGLIFGEADGVDIASPTSDHDCGSGSGSQTNLTGALDLLTSESGEKSKARRRIEQAIHRHKSKLSALLERDHPK
jgi:hypothetical protein